MKIRNRYKWSVIWVLLLTALFAGAVFAVPTEGDHILLQSGDYELYVDPTAAWTIDSIRFDGTIVGQNNGHYGTVFAETGYEFIGTGHSEGGVELVTNLVLMVDGTSLGEPVPGTTYSGTNLTLVKWSKIANIDEQFTINLTPERIAEEVTLTVATNQYVDKLYAFMHIFPTNTTDWIAQAGTTAYQGTLENSGGWALKQDVDWVAIYNPVDELGMLVSYAELYDTDNSDIKPEF